MSLRSYVALMFDTGETRGLREQVSRLAAENTMLRTHMTGWQKRAEQSLRATQIAQAAYDVKADELGKAMLMASTHPAYGTAREQELSAQVEALTAEVDRLTHMLAKGAA